MKIPFWANGSSAVEIALLDFKVFRALDRKKYQN